MHWMRTISSSKASFRKGLYFMSETSSLLAWIERAETENSQESQTLRMQVIRIK